MRHSKARLEPSFDLFLLSSTRARRGLPGGAHASLSGLKANSQRLLPMYSVHASS
ncbi:hypothetical protein LZ30DRAFT_735787 [Colletotrichum cereale]|nr:hypothetical protein LZ30DRAFT_735787 [Colletotrichum cereale]